MAIAGEKEKVKVRSRKPKSLAWINESCTGCAGSPVCQTLCPVEECMIAVQNPDAPTMIMIWVDPLKCIGCTKCVTKGPKGIYLEGCPWNAIDMIPTEVFEKDHGILAY